MTSKSVILQRRMAVKLCTYPAHCMYSCIERSNLRGIKMQLATCINIAAGDPLHALI